MRSLIVVVVVRERPFHSRHPPAPMPKTLTTTQANNVITAATASEG